MTQNTVISALSQFFFIVGIVSILYGLALWSSPIALVVGGILVAVIAFLVGYGNLDLHKRNRSGR